jgi:hypothetical protein
MNEAFFFAEENGRTKSKFKMSTTLRYAETQNLEAA